MTILALTEYELLRITLIPIGACIMLFLFFLVIYIRMINSMKNNEILKWYIQTKRHIRFFNWLGRYEERSQIPASPNDQNDSAIQKNLNKREKEIYLLYQQGDNLEEIAGRFNSDARSIKVEINVIETKLDQAIRLEKGRL